LRSDLVQAGGANRTPPRRGLPVDSERLLVERAARGDQHAVGLLYDAYVEPLYRFCLSRVGNETDAEDLAEEIFIKVMRAVPGFEWRPLGLLGSSPSSEADGLAQTDAAAAGGSVESLEERSPFRAWLFRIARNHIVSHYRRSSIRSTVGEVPEWIADEHRGPAELAETSITIREIFAAVELLSPAQREVIQLRFGAGMSVAETAQALEKNETNVKVLQHKGIKRLKEILEAQDNAAEAAAGEAARQRTKEHPGRWVR
jgi:RNA polymerase sigma-70 factor, ECF subfamily